MCGISGLIDYRKQSSTSILQTMSDTLFHRGPDGEGLAWFDDTYAQIGFAHRRLSIIDLSEGGRQPMSYKHLHVVFNGEIYNYQEIKNKLIALGHTFNSHSDTEVILHAFEVWGISCIQDFIGMFAIVLYNDITHDIYCIRDRAGIKPFYYYKTADVFLFASELKAIIAHPAFTKQLNHDAVAAYFQYGYVPHPHCIYQDTYKLSPGHYLHMPLSSRQLTLQQYWNVYDAYNKPSLDLSFDEAKSATEKLLSSACQYRMVSDVPVGVFLSGGYDSTAVTALLQSQATEKIKTFTIGFNEQKLNEATFAKEVAQYLGTDHTEYYCTEKEALDIVPKLPYYYDEPFADSSAIPTTLVSAIARKKVTVALSADAGDEVFAGYNRYDYIMKFGNQVKSIPPFVRKSIAKVMQHIDADQIPYFKHKYLFHSRYEKVKQFLQQPDDFHMNQALSQQFLLNDLKYLLKHPAQKIVTAFDSQALQSEHYSTLHYIMAIDYQTYLVDDILQKVDRATMTHSLEGREPFLDHRVIEWAAQLPISFKYHQGVKKHILREIVHQYVPKQMMDRPKMGFAIPVDQWLMNELKPYVDQFFDRAYLEKQGLFHIDAVLQIIQSFYTGKKERAEKIWYLLMFQMWYDQWMR